MTLGWRQQFRCRPGHLDVQSRCPNCIDVRMRGGGVPCHGDLRTAVRRGPLQQGTDAGLIARRGASRAAGRARLAVRGPELTAVRIGSAPIRVIGDGGRGRDRRHRPARASNVTTEPCSVDSSHRIVTNCGRGFIGSSQPGATTGPAGQYPLHLVRRRGRAHGSLVRESGEDATAGGLRSTLSLCETSDPLADRHPLRAGRMRGIPPARAVNGLHVYSTTSLSSSARLHTRVAGMAGATGTTFLGSCQERPGYDERG
jgi:hypothetical protein